MNRFSRAYGAGKILSDDGKYWLFRNAEKLDFYLVIIILTLKIIQKIRWFELTKFGSGYIM